MKCPNCESDRVSKLIGGIDGFSCLDCWVVWKEENK